MAPMMANIARPMGLSVSIRYKTLMKRTERYLNFVSALIRCWMVRDAAYLEIARRLFAGMTHERPERGCSDGPFCV